MSARVWADLALLALVWAGSFFFVEVALDDFGPLTVVACRVGLGALGLFAWAAASGVAMPRALRPWVAFAVMGALNNALPFTLIAWGQTRIDSGLASILNAATPLFTVVLAHYLTRDEKMSANKVVGVAVGFVGIVVLIGPGALAGLGGELLAQTAILAAACSYGFAGIWGRRFRNLPALVPATGMLIGSAAVMLPLALFVERPWTTPAPGPATLASIAGLALMSTAFAYILYFRILKSAGAVNLLLVTFMIPPVAVLLGWAVLGERVGFGAFAGMALIFAGLVAVDGRLLAGFNRRRQRRRCGAAKIRARP